MKRTNSVRERGWIARLANCSVLGCFRYTATTGDTTNGREMDENERKRTVLYAERNLNAQKRCSNL